MEEIALLQKKLIEIQQINPLNKISERVAVEIIHNTQQHLGFHLILTQDGSEYITPEFLSKQLEEEFIFTSKISKSQLSEKFNVKFDTLEPFLNKIMAKNSILRKIEDHFITEKYLNDIIVRISEDLTEKHAIFLSEISLKYEIPIGFTREFLLEQLNINNIQGKIYNDKIYSLEYENNFNIRLRGLLKGSYFPISLLRIQEEFNDKNILTMEEIRKKIINLIETKEIDGKIYESTYYNHHFLINRDKFVLENISKNKYIEYQTLRHLFIKNYENYLENMISIEKLIFLSQSVVFKEFILLSKEQIISQIETEGYINLEKFFVFLDNSEDVEKILGPKILNLDINQMEIEKTCVFKNDLVQKLVILFKDKLRVSQQKKKKNNSKPISEEMIEKELSIFPSIIYDPQSKECLFDLFYRKADELTIEFEENNDRFSFYLEKISNRIRNLWNSLNFTYNCYQEGRVTAVQFSGPMNSQTIVDNLFNQSINLIEFTIFFNLKRYEIEIPSNFYFFEDINSISWYEESQIFKNRDFAEKSIELLPWSVGSKITQAEELMFDEEYKEFLDFLEENQEEIYGRCPFDSEEKQKEDKKYLSPQKNKKRKLQHKKSRSTLC